MRWGTLVTIIGVIETGGYNGTDLIHFMHPEGTFGAVDAFTWREHVRSEKISLAVGLNDV